MCERGVKMKILLVDDSSTIRRVLTNVLSRMFKEDVTFLEAENGEVALNVLRENAPIDLIFLDFNMPVMNGDEFLTAVRAMKEYNAIRIVMCTTEAEKSTVLSLMKKGVNGYIVKPFSPDVVRKAIAPIVARMGYELLAG